MASPTLLLAQYLGLDVYDPASVDLALKTLLRIRHLFPAKQSCVIGGTAVIHHVGKQNRQISPDLDLLISIGSQKLIERHFRTAANNFGLSIDCGEIAIDCIATSDPMEHEIIETSQIANMAGSLIRVASISGLMAMKFKSGRTKDLEDLGLLLAISLNKPDHRRILEIARSLIQRHHENEAEDFESELHSSILSIRRNGKPPDRT